MSKNNLKIDMFQECVEAIDISRRYVEIQRSGTQAVRSFNKAGCL